MPSITTRTYAERAAKHPVPVAKQLLDICDRKKTNLCVSVDVTSKAGLLRIAEAAGPYCCCIKTHIDIVEDFDRDLVQQLQALADKHDFLIWEDRKFADIGSTVRLQYSSGIYKIASWAHITNAHLVPGEGILTGLASVGLPLGRGLLLLAEMSAKGNLATGEYTAKNVEAARRHPEFVMGFVAMRRVDEREETAGGVAPGEGADYVIMTPGVGLDSKGDGMGQQYRTPDEVIRESGCDVIIVGRGIYGGGDGNPNEEIVKQCKRYQEAGWKAYEDRLRQ
uniref:Orotidine 5'-phosphate decarboxylase n=1 Tax=Rhodotorula toruloides TaxID=5286 RepID=B3GF12_RHOTO|nr:orotidine 5'-phosphate decarboxylase [Rhodotorula toruloides]ACD75179.1 orotidine 5'-phosphate decarboxylase [Rhodotorula toruloides]